MLVIARLYSKKLLQIYGQLRQLAERNAGRLRGYLVGSASAVVSLSTLGELKISELPMAHCIDLVGMSSFAGSVITSFEMKDSTEQHMIVKGSIHRIIFPMLLETLCSIRIYQEALRAASSK